MGFLEQKISELALPKTEKRVADYILVNQDNVGLKTVTELAEDIGVSGTSIIRFVRRLGYKSFAEFKKEMSHRLLQNSRDAHSASKYARSRPALTKGDLVGEVYTRALENIQKTCEDLNKEVINRIASLLISSRMKYVCGFRTTFSCAHYLSSKLIYFVPNVVCLGVSERDALERMIDITAEDCLVLFSFPKYSEINYSLMEIARKKGAKIVLITDQVTAPLTSKADIVVPASISGLGLTNSYVAAVCLSEILLFAVSRKVDISLSERAGQFDHYLEKHRLY